MSETKITVERVNSVEAHPNADRLDIIQVLDYKIVTQKGIFQVGNSVAYFPPDILIPSQSAKLFGVENYLKHAVFPGTEEKTQCRVASARIRGVPSHGFVLPWDQLEDMRAFGTDLTEEYRAHKYIAPVRVGAGDAETEISAFHTYTDIENTQRFPDAFCDNQRVIITEKIHGTNCRLGLVRDNGEYVFCAGSHKVRRKEGGLYWEAMTEDAMNLLTYLANNSCCNDEPCHDVILFGEIFGPGIQDMDYGQQGHSFRAFDISIDGVYMDYWDMVSTCDYFNVERVPQLFDGDYHCATIEDQTYGETSFGGVKSKFKGREGCVIRPWTEQHSDVLGGRLILKSVSADYRDRKGAKDIA